jgi:importin subunit beta-1
MVDVISLESVLQQALQPDVTARQSAELTVKQLENQKYPTFVASLCAEFATEAKPQETRRLAGLLLKNSLTSKDSTLQV